MKHLNLPLIGSLMIGPSLFADLTVTRVDGPPDGDSVVIQQIERDETGPTSFRFYAPRSGPPTKTDCLVYDPDPTRPREEILADAEARYFFRDRDLGQTFRTDERGFKLKAITVRLQPVNVEAADPSNARVSVQILKVTGSPVVNENGTAGGDAPFNRPAWQTYAFMWPDDPSDTNTPDRKPVQHTSDDFIEGESYEHLHLASGGVIPEGLRNNDYLRWEFSGEDQFAFEPNTKYAFLFLFDDPAGPDVKRNIPLSNINVLPGGKETDPFPDGHMIRREGSSTVRDEVFIAEMEDAEDVMASRTAASFPLSMPERLAISPGTLGYPDVDTYRDLYFLIERVKESND